MRITMKRRHGAWVLRLIGPLTRPQGIVDLRAAIERLAGRRQGRILLDLAGVAYLDAAGIGELIGCVHRVRRSGGEIALAAAGDKVREILRLSGADLPLADDVDEALRRLRRWRRGAVRPRDEDRGVARLQPSRGPGIIRRTTEGPWRFTPIHG
jgi:anti-anti-sigma factor